MQEFKWRATPQSLSAINFVPCRTCMDDCRIQFYEGDKSVLCALCPKSNSKYAQEYRKYKENKRQKNENGNIPIKRSLTTYMFDDTDIEVLKIGAERNGENLYDYLDSMIGKESIVITSCKSALLLDKSKIERDSSKGDNDGRD